MVVIIRDTIQHMIDQKMTLEQIKAAAPAKGVGAAVRGDVGALDHE